MTVIIQLNPSEWSKCLGVAENKVHVLSIDLVGQGAIPAGIAVLGIKQIGQRYLGADLDQTADRSLQNQIEAVFRWREKIVS